MSKRLNRFGALLVCAGCAASVYGQTARPRVWISGLPVSGSAGVVATDADFYPLVRISLFNAQTATWRTPEEVADLITPPSFPTDSTRLGIELHNFGAKGATGYDGSNGLALDPGDGVQGPGGGALAFNPAPSGGETVPSLIPTRSTPWNQNGIADTSAWIDAFRARLVQRISTSGGTIPAPYRFHFDNEFRIESCCGNEHLWLFDAMKQCVNGTAGNRLVGGVGGPVYNAWTAEPVLVPERTSATGQSTMSALAASAPSYNRAYGLNDSANRNFQLWWGKIITEAMNRATEEGAYKRLRLSWPDVKCSNYDIDVRVDGEPNDPVYAAYGGRVHPDFGQHGSSWARTSWYGAGDLQAPVLYPCHPNHDTTSTPSVERASEMVARQKLDSIMFSVIPGDTLSKDIVAWIPLFDISGWHDTLDAANANYSITREYLYRILALARSRAVGEMILFCGDSFSDVRANATEKIVDHVWGSHLTSSLVTVGSGPGGNIASTLSTALRSYAEVTPSSGTVTFSGEFNTSFRDQYSSGNAPRVRKLRLIIETGPGTTGTPSVKFYNYKTSAWDSATYVSTLDSVNGASKAFEVTSSSAEPNNEDYLDTGSFRPAKIELTFTGATSNVKLDSMLLIAVGSRCRGDANDDGNVNFADTTSVLGQYGSTGEDVDGDADSDGDVDFQDLTLVASLLNSNITGCR